MPRGGKKAKKWSQLTSLIFMARNASYWIWPNLPRFGANFTLFSGPKWPEIPQIMCSGTDYGHTVLVGAIGGHLGSFGGHLGPFGGQSEAEDEDAGC